MICGSDESGRWLFDLSEKQGTFSDITRTRGVMQLIDLPIEPSIYRFGRVRWSRPP